MAHVTNLGHGAKFVSGDQRYDAGTDPAAGLDGMPPNMGEFVLPHVFSFQGIAGSQAKVYRPSDEAIKDSFDNARFMRNDMSIMECVEMRQRAVALLDWSIEPEDEDDAEQQDLCNALTSIVDRIPRWMQYRENLLHAIFYGKYGVENRWGYKMIKGKMRPTIVQWLPVNGDKIVFRYDDGLGEHRPDQIGIRIGAGYTTGPNLAMRWANEAASKVESTDHGLAYFLDTWERPLLSLHKHRIEDGEYDEPTNAGRIHGVGIRSVIYWGWYQKQEALAFLMEYLERSAAGVELWYFPMGNPTAEVAMRKAAEEKVSGGSTRNVLMIPRPPGEDGALYDVQRIEPSMAGAAELKSIITEYFGHQIKRYILGQTLTSEAEATGLGSGVADIHMDTFMQIVRYDSNNLEETITEEVLRPLQRLAFPQYANLDLRFRIATSEPDAESMLQAYQLAYGMGLKLNAKQIRDLIGAPAPEDGDEVLDQMAQMQQQQEAMAAQQQDPAMGGVPGGGPEQPPEPSQATSSAPAEATEPAEYSAGVPSENSDREKLLDAA